MARASAAATQAGAHGLVPPPLCWAVKRGWTHVVVMRAKHALLSRVLNTSAGWGPWISEPLLPLQDGLVAARGRNTRPSHVLPLLCRLAQATGFFIPVAPVLLEMLHWSQLNKPPRTAAGVNMPDMGLQLRAGSSVLRLPAFQEEVVTQVGRRVV